MAENKFIWTVTATKILISAYEEHEFLYKNEDPNYKNRNKRLDVYKKIAETLGNGCTVEDVKKKLNGLRSQYLAEKMKITRSLKSGADGDQIYQPTVYWFPLLKFLDRSTEADESQSNLDPPQESENDAGEAMDDNLGEDTETPNATQDVTSLLAGNQKRKNVVQSPKLKKKKAICYDTLLYQASNTMAEMSNICRETSVIPKAAPDSLDSFGQFIVAELRGIQNASNDVILRQAKRKIQQVIMETWDTIDQSVMVDSPSSQYSQWPTTPQSDSCSLNNQTDDSEVQNDNNLNNMVQNALLLANITDEDVATY